jgi:hypothetical protein
MMAVQDDLPCPTRAAFNPNSDHPLFGCRGVFGGVEHAVQVRACEALVAASQLGVLLTEIPHSGLDGIVHAPADRQESMQRQLRPRR